MLLSASSSSISFNQHLERDLQKLFDSSNHPWVKALKELIQSMMHDRKHLIAEGVTAFPKEVVETFIMKVDSLLADGYKEYIADLGHYYENDENALLNRIRDYTVTLEDLTGRGWLTSDGCWRTAYPRKSR